MTPDLLHSAPETRPQRPLRAGYLINKYPAVSQTFILREVVALRQRGIDVEVASINEPPPHRDLTGQERSESEATFYVKRQGKGGAFSAVAWCLWRTPIGLLRGLRIVASLGGMEPRRTLLCFFYLVEAAIVAKWMRQRALTHLHVHFATQVATVALILSYIVPVTLSITVHGPDEFYDVSGHFLRRKVARANFIVCISFFAVSQLLVIVGDGRQGEKLDLARLGVDCYYFPVRPFRKTPELFQILCVARLVPTKGLPVLIEAVHQLLQKGRSLELNLVGDGPERSELEQLVETKELSNHVHLKGSVNQDEIQSFYSSADIFALPSFAEGIPVVLMEAMAREIPCVATRINGIPELIRDGVDGLLVSPADVQGLVSALERLMDEPELRLALGKAGRVRVQQEYELSQSTDRLASVFRNRLEALQ